ncbi:BEL1-like homeodomain protein 7 isoform X1 [Salvia miltiorrhiza]|uniref:BEL1-like homeodomain protein 7 isoform X1 n=2 Tax=Salvia miltiorrhiza TaxID=226208 RepID=UPI0025ACDEEA|nr:BEL1-like homeodomain protein 7 isoform X1 [Salvia miltiorrhiza]XP_057782488.1 BEL1-like homeodomain protein 7 isoform X1 [Salvia miltiorrhiza]
MNSYRPDLHIAQQSRRDKLRIQQDIYANNFPHDALNFDSSADVRSCRNGNICYDPSELCPEMINFSVNPLLKDGLMGAEKRAPFPTSFSPSATVSSSDPQYFSTCDWVANHSSIYANPISALDVKPNYLGYDQDMNGAASSLYQNALQDLVTSSNNVRSFGLEFASLRHKSSGEAGHGPWVVGGSELMLLPDQMRLKTQSGLITRPVDGCSQWSGELEFAAPKDLDRDHSNTQALSLSLSSVPSPKVHEAQITERDFQTRDVCGSTNVQDSRIWKPELPSPNQNMSAGSRVLGAQASTHRNPGPLGPFTGYATILRSSRFLRPAQQLLEDLCCIAGTKEVEACDVSDEIMEEVRVSSEGASNNAEHAMAGNNSGGLSSFVYNGSSDKSRDAGGTSCSTDAHRPENLQRKAKLLFMQDEVCKRYKQYHQQMQMVVSSFESVAGLSAATPYVSLALKMIAKHFRCLKNTITDQLKSIKNALRDEFSSPSAGAGGNKGDANASVLKFFDQGFQKQKGTGILEGQHIWRPQRGLPERAVSILRAWLFDHFLHPYPTDTDKHMLATQTGLTRNQVSNWFINARVRVWKPMVEEIHMLETKGSDNSGKSSNGKTADGGCAQADDSSQRLRTRAIPDKQVECSSFVPPGQEGDRSKASPWGQEKRSRIEYHVPSSVDGTLMGFVPSHRNGMEMGGIGSVSLTLGLRQSPEGGQRPAMQQERHMRHYGGQIIRDFVG